MNSNITSLKRLAEQQFQAARADLGKPGRTPAVRAYYQTLNRLQGLLRQRAARNNEATQ